MRFQVYNLYLERLFKKGTVIFGISPPGCRSSLSSMFLRYNIASCCFFVSGSGALTPGVR